ncbi:MAG: type II toxin-antitoxin system Phd/YefM family antitoxin [Gammaproteobacteria bacterium]
MHQQQVSLREANQHLSQYIDIVQQGTEIIITRRGVPVAKILPIPIKRQLSAAQKKIKNQLLTSLRKGYHLGGGKFDRESSHER